MAKSKQKLDGEGSTYPIKGGKWQASLSLGVDENGKRIRKYRNCRSQADAKAALLEMQIEKSQGIIVNPSRMTVGDLLTKWLSEVIQGERADNTEESYRLAIEKHIRPSMGRLKLSDCKASQVQSLFDRMKKKGVGDRTRQNAYTVLNAVMKKAKRWGMIMVNPCEGVDKPQYRPKRMSPFTLEESKRILESEVDSEESAIWTLALSAGMRQGEIFGLPWKNVNFKEKLVTIDQQLIEVKGKLSIQRPKTETSIRTIELTDQCASALNRQRMRMLKEGLTGEQLIFLNEDGGMLRKNSFRKWTWLPLLTRLGLKPRGFHNLRHTYASLALGAGVPVHVVSKIMGHASPATTLRIYAHLLEGQQTEAKMAITRLLG